MRYSKEGYAMIFLLAGAYLPGSGQEKNVRAMLEQLAALKQYGATLEKGYRLAEDGLHLVRDLQAGELHLHQVFFGSLQQADDAVLSWPGGKRCIVEMDLMESDFDRAIEQYASSGWMRSPELAYVGSVRAEVVRKNKQDVDVLGTLKKDGALSMTDGERIGEMEKIVQTVHLRRLTVQAFLRQGYWLITQREKEQLFTGTFKKMYGLE
jgi:hypothetical protein